MRSRDRRRREGWSVVGRESGLGAWAGEGTVTCAGESKFSDDQLIIAGKNHGSRRVQRGGRVASQQQAAGSLKWKHCLKM